MCCWLKFDARFSAAVDSSCVLSPIAIGQSEHVDIGTGMYESTWGHTFADGDCVLLHPDGITIGQMPGNLTSAPPFHTYRHANFTHRFLTADEGVLNPRTFTMCCYFFWPPPDRNNRAMNFGGPSWEGKRVLVQSRDGHNIIFMEDDKWFVTDENGYVHHIHTPKLRRGWHMVGLVAHEGGTLFGLDTWSHHMSNVMVSNNFYAVGNRYQENDNDSLNYPFGTIADFRIYNGERPWQEIQKEMKNAWDHGEEAVPQKMMLAIGNAGAIVSLASCFDVPDLTCEALRALGNLATY